MYGWWRDPEPWLAIAVVLMLGGALAWIIHSEISWHYYAVAHHCTRTGNMQSTVIWQYIYDGKGNLLGLIPQTITDFEYHCDTGNYWH